jgi:NAD-dependent dihydropyrimidine dehydrogenase PreA subunit
MGFVITDACVDVLDRSCIEECPVDCIYEGDRKMYINPAECIDCGACEQICPTTAALSIVKVTDTDAAWNVQDNIDFFETSLEGKDAPLGTPGGASHIGKIGVDTARVAELPPRPAD